MTNRNTHTRAREREHTHKHKQVYYLPRRIVQSAKLPIRENASTKIRAIQNTLVP